MVAKVDFKSSIPSYRARSGRFDLISVPTQQFLMIDGSGDPNTSTAYRDAIQTLFPVAYALKFLSKTSLERDYTVMPLEALWWAEDMSSFTTARDKTAWQWTAMIMTPDWLGPDHLADAVARVRAKGGAPQLNDLRLESLTEGDAVQTLHIGSYDSEAPVIEAMHRELAERGLAPSGKHHEVYLSDARRTSPEKLRTILRQPATRTV